MAFNAKKVFTLTWIMEVFKRSCLILLQPIFMLKFFTLKGAAYRIKGDARSVSQTSGNILFFNNRKEIFL